MSMYNLLFGKNPQTEIVLSLIGLKECDIQRFRDCWIDFENEEIVVFTRTGGPNRKDYSNDNLIKNPYFKNTYDDNFDSTYAYYRFKIPEEIKEDVKGLKEPEKYGISAKLIQWVFKTLKRKPTEADTRSEKIKKEEKIVKNLIYYRHVDLWNGWVLVPLDENGFVTLLELMEENNGELMFYTVLPLKPRIIVDKIWDIDNEYYVIKIDSPIDWKLHKDFWNYIKNKYEKNYPKAISNIEQKICKYVNKKED